MATGKGKIYKAWYSKAEQIVMKAKFSLKEDKKAMEEISYYANQINIKVN
jgi:predicted nucleotidyltransferase